MISPEEFAKLQKHADDTAAQKAEAQGALNELMKQLKAEFKVSTLEEAQALLKKLEAKEGRLGREYEEAVAAFKRRWKQSLEDV